MLTIEQIRAAHGPDLLEIDVPEWGGKVLARRMTAQDFIAANRERDNSEDEAKNFAYMKSLLTRLLVNEDRTPLFANGDGKILDDSPLIVLRLGKELIDRNGIGKGAEKNGSGGQ